MNRSHLLWLAGFMAFGSLVFCGLKAIFQYQPSDASHWAAAALAGAPAGIVFGLIVTTIAQFRTEAHDAEKNRRLRRELRRDIESLAGKTVVKWRGVEMALNEDLLWRHETIPFLQCDTLDVLVEEDWLRFRAEMYGEKSCGHGVAIAEAEGRVTLADTIPNSLWRKRELNCLPSGTIQTVECEVNCNELIACVRLSIENAIVEVRTGEVDERDDGVYYTRLFDESLLIQVDGRHPEPDDSTGR